MINNKMISKEKGEIENRTMVDSLKENNKKNEKEEKIDKSTVEKELSPATKLVIDACNNYINVNPESPKTIDVYQIKSALYYKNRYYDSSRSVYFIIMKKYPGTKYEFDAIRMTAQSYYEEKKYSDAGEWYRKLSEVTSDSTDKTEAIARIAETIFRLAEVNEANGKYEEAVNGYERVALEYPDAAIADVALFNAGMCCEKLLKWSKAVLIYEKLAKKYELSRLQGKSMFRIGKCYEKMEKWDLAANAYLLIPSKKPESELASVALYNAGYCFENEEKYYEAASVLEKFVMTYPEKEDAADVLFRVGELYGKIKDWEAVARVSSVFTQKYGNDKNRIIQVLCMTGVAHYMRNRIEQALKELNNAVTTYRKMSNPSEMNIYYAAKAMFTIGEIKHEDMRNDSLTVLGRAYRKKIKRKSDKLDEAVKAYTGVIKFNLSEWTTRALFQIGQAYEDFAMGIFNQKREEVKSLDKRIAIELGIAQAIEKYCMEKAIVFHEKNVKIGVKEQIEDKYVIESKKKVTYLPFLVAEIYLAIVDITKSTRSNEKLEGFGLIAKKLELFQKIAPFQKKAIELYLNCLENGIAYNQQDTYYQKASLTITDQSLGVGKIYSEVVNIAREAPIPSGFDDYEVFVYKTKLLHQIEEYENQALENYLKTIKIAEIYRLNDSSVVDAQKYIGKLLFNRGRCYDLLCIHAFSNPPYPKNISEEEKEVYKVRFEEIGLRLQEKAFGIYKELLELAEKKYAQGQYVTHAYIRLYQNFPEKYGVKNPKVIQTVIGSGPQWKSHSGFIENWTSPSFNDTLWKKIIRAPVSTASVTGFPGNVPIPMWHEFDEDETKTDSSKLVFFRRVFTLDDLPSSAVLYIAAMGEISVFINEKSIIRDTSVEFSTETMKFNILGALQRGKNILGIEIEPKDITGYGIFPLLLIKTGKNEPLPQPPGYDTPMAVEDAGVDVYTFPLIKNFTNE